MLNNRNLNLEKLPKKIDYCLDDPTYVWWINLVIFEILFVVGFKSYKKFKTSDVA